MLPAALVTPLTLLAVAWPFAFSFTAAPSANFWPWAQAWALGLGLALIGCWQLWARPRRSLRADGCNLAVHLGLGVLLGALVASVIGLAQYFGGDLGLSPWIHASIPGTAMGNLRQRNQQATLLSMGLWVLFWWLAQVQARLEGRQGASGRRTYAALVGRCRVPVWLLGLLLIWALTLMAVGSAATASRTGAVQWLLILGLLVLWRRTMGRAALVLAVIGLAIYAFVGWLLPQLLYEWTGFRGDSVFSRMAGDSISCVSRKVLWSNMLTLIAQKPWAGWGWGELDYAHYMTQYSGKRFCLLLDNAHNLPLHLAVELGLPIAFLVFAAMLCWAWSARPWAEQHPARQLAWGLLLPVALHSMVEFPLWYGPFQVSCAMALLVLWLTAPQRPLKKDWSRLQLLVVTAVAAALAGALAWAAQDYFRVSQLYKPVAQRAAAYKNYTPAEAAESVFFADHADFALLTTTPVTQANAQQVHDLAKDLLHYSPEPRVVQLVIDSALLLGREEEANFHLQRLREVYPDEYVAWQRSRTGAAASQP